MRQKFRFIYARPQAGGPRTYSVSPEIANTGGLSHMHVDISGDHPQALPTASYQEAACAVKAGAGAGDRIFFARRAYRDSPAEQGVVAVIFLKRLGKRPLIATRNQACKAPSQFDRQSIQINAA